MYNAFKIYFYYQWVVATVDLIHCVIQQFKFVNDGDDPAKMPICDGAHLVA